MYAIPLVSGPTLTRPLHNNAHQNDGNRQYKGSSDLEPAFLHLYHSTSQLLLRLTQASPIRHSGVILMGEGMLALWTGLKSVLCCSHNVKYEERPVKRVLSVSFGVYGTGVYEMAKSLLPSEHPSSTYLFEIDPFNSTFDEKTVEKLKVKLLEFQPDLVTMVHCDTPTGTRLPTRVMSDLCTFIKNTTHFPRPPLIFLDCVSSVGGSVVLLDEWQVDLACIGMQKVLGGSSAVSALIVSQQTWEMAKTVDYRSGYDALVPFHHLDQVCRQVWESVGRSDADVDWRAWKLKHGGLEVEYATPYTFDWDLVQIIHDRLKELLSGEIEYASLESVPSENELFEQLPEYDRHEVEIENGMATNEPGLSKSIRHHRLVHMFTLAALKKAGLKLFCRDIRMAAPTSTAVMFEDVGPIKERLMAAGVALSGSMGKYKHQILRLGHMGAFQAKPKYISEAIGVLSNK